MAARAIVREGDTTSHGGTVLESFPNFNIYGKNASGIGHRGYCPQCKTEFVIVAGAQNFIFMGKNVAVEGMLTSCGAVLIASQWQATVDIEPGAVKMVPGAAERDDRGRSVLAGPRPELDRVCLAGPGELPGLDLHHQLQRWQFERDDI